jgi:hypothetical protein
LSLQYRIDHRLNIIERKQWVRLYLRCYLSIADDDRRGVLEDGSLSCHLITREEDLLKIGAVSLECLITFLRQGVEGRFDDVVLNEVGFVGAGVPPFMLDVREVVNSPTESPKCVAT